MNRLSTLGGLIIGAILLAAIYGTAFGGRDEAIDIKFDDGEGVRQVVSGDRGSFALKKDGLELEASWRGAYELTNNGDDIAELDHKLEITRKQDDRDERVTYENDDDDVKSVYYLDGEKQDQNAETDAAQKALLTAFLEASGAKAEERVESLLREGGPAAVLEKIDGMYSDHARLRYVTELTKQADLSSSDVKSLLASLKNIEGDHDLRVALDALLESDSVNADEMPAFLDAASRIESSYDLRRLIESVSEKDLNEDAVSLAIRLLERIESSHDIRRASEALLERDDLSAKDAARLLDTVGDHIDSDHDLRLVLSDTTQFLADGDEAVFVHGDFDTVGMARHRFVHGVIKDFREQMVQGALIGAADIHARSFANRLQPFEHFNRGSVIALVLSGHSRAGRGRSHGFGRRSFGDSRRRLRCWGLF